MKAIIMAGGKGTRVLSLTNDEIPKPMLPICGKPILQHQIENMKKCGIEDIILIVGYKSERITEYFSDGSLFGVRINYIYEETPLGTAGALSYLRNRINEDFFVVYGDIVFDIDMERMMAYHHTKGGVATLFIHPNSHPYDSDLVSMDENALITKFDSKNNTRNYYYDNYVNAGIYIFSPTLLDYLPEVKKTDLEKDILVPLIPMHCIYGYCSPEYVKDAGTPERIYSTEGDIKNQIVAKRNLSKSQKCIFLDRDGTINRYKGLLSNEANLELEEGVVDAVKMINKSEYLCIVVTNQPVVARGLCTIEELEHIHKKMKTLFGNNGAYLDDVLYCPHHPHKGYPEENPAYKIECQCRKPKIGMLELAAKKYNIDLSQSWMVGDTTVDLQTGIIAGTKTALVETGEKGLDGKFNVKADIQAKNLHEVIRIILGDRK